MDCYEFYRVVYAATTINEHDFNLKENLPKLTAKQKSYIYEILMKSLNKPKLKKVIDELSALQPENGTLEKKWLEDFKRVY